MGVDKDSAAVSAPAVAITLATPQLRKSQNHRSKEDDKVTDTTSHHRGLYRWAWCRRFASIGWATSLVIAFIFVVSIVWTAFLVVINVAPNGSANAVMTTGTLDGGNFWQFSAPTDSIVSISSILLLAIVLIYSYLLLLLLFGPPAPRAPRQGRARPRQPNAQANRLRRNAATMSRLAVPLATLRRKSRPVTQFYHELVVPDGKYRKLYVRTPLCDALLLDARSNPWLWICRRMSPWRSPKSCCRYSRCAATCSRASIRRSCTCTRASWLPTPTLCSTPSSLVGEKTRSTKSCTTPCTSATSMAITLVSSPQLTHPATQVRRHVRRLLPSPGALVLCGQLPGRPRVGQNPPAVLSTARVRTHGPHLRRAGTGQHIQRWLRELDYDRRQRHFPENRFQPALVHALAQDPAAVDGGCQAKAVRTAPTQTESIRPIPSACRISAG